MPDLHASPKHLEQKPDAGSLSMSSARFSMLALAVAYTLFVIYGSLVPLNFQHHSWQEASEAFKNIRYLSLGIGSRADWVANILLYVPLAFVWLGTLWHSKSVAWRIVAPLFVLLACISLSVAIEFTQIFFPPRTVSLNDIIAEIAGTTLGIALWPLIGMRLVHLVRTIFQGDTNARYAALIVYALAYVVLSLFPYDFLLSHGELQAHISIGISGVAICTELRRWVRVEIDSRNYSDRTPRHAGCACFRSDTARATLVGCSGRDVIGSIDRGAATDDCARHQPGCLDWLKSGRYDAKGIADAVGTWC